MLTNERSSALNPTPRLGLLDALRIVAALVVVLYHYTAWGHQHWGEGALEAWPILSQFTIYGSIGVQLFFLISGFVILMSVQGKGLIQFIGSRLGRLYPAYWLAVAAAALLTFRLWPAAKDGRTTQDIVPNLTMAQAGMGVRDLDGVYWTLWVELRFYLILAVLVAFGLVRDRVILWLSLLWPVLGLYLHISNATKAQEWVMGQYAPLFAIGMVTFLMHRGMQTPWRWLLIAFNTVLACYFTGVKGRKDSDFLSGVDIPAWHFSVLVLGCIVLLLLCTLTPLKTVHARWMVTAGMLTYPLYLFHQLWGWWMIEQFSSVLNKYVLLTLTVVLMLALAYLVARFIEKPAGLWLRNEFIRSATWLTRKAGEAAAASAAWITPARKYQPLSRQIR
ncbi:acyltransferase [Glutamicibacter sp. MNS18]|uniref:acyltransferase family protein n=1 Tax=Glutamicibacter sp. MNS18 TaxID=2989817 RepID=UPI00223618F2|nr:acyltransferase [Glutamicibacter sp. MNS18]MCW4464144.1 acyltransferase [Glutamicibacter sp. MNS18]